MEHARVLYLDELMDEYRCGDFLRLARVYLYATALHIYTPYSLFTIIT